MNQGLTSMNGNILAAKGNITATAGNITADTGDIEGRYLKARGAASGRMITIGSQNGDYNHINAEFTSLSA